MAIAYGFAQAGVLNTRSGGMSAYAEESYGKSGFFIVFYLYFFSLAIGNVAIAISAVGYLATFFPWLASAPIAMDRGLKGWSTEPSGVDLVTLPRSEVGEYCPLVSP